MYSLTTYCTRPPSFRAFPFPTVARKSPTHRNASAIHLTPRGRFQCQHSRRYRSVIRINENEYDNPPAFRSFRASGVIVLAAHKEAAPPRRQRGFAPSAQFAQSSSEYSRFRFLSGFAIRFESETPDNRKRFFEFFDPCAFTYFLRFLCGVLRVKAAKVRNDFASTRSNKESS